MELKRRIEMVHFQLTKKCNLHCWFCGQQGEKGFFANDVGKAMELEDWYDIINQLIEYRKNTGISPFIMLWGGEPLVSVHFEKIVKRLKEFDFRLGIVTNGTKIDRYSEILKNDFDEIYISIDGNRDIHDSIRGKGVFDRVKTNISKIKGGNAKIYSMSVMSEDFLDIMPEMPSVLYDMGIDEAIFQEMICLNHEETVKYKKDMKEIFNINATEIDSWEFDGKNEKKQAEQLKKVLNQNNKIPVRYLPHNCDGFCKSPFRHIHISWKGDILFCTDFYDFSAGNVHENSIKDIFYGEKAEKFRNYVESGECPTCKHCSWRLRKDYSAKYTEREVL